MLNLLKRAWAAYLALAMDPTPLTQEETWP